MQSEVTKQIILSLKQNMFDFSRSLFLKRPQICNLTYFAVPSPTDPLITSIEFLTKLHLVLNKQCPRVAKATQITIQCKHPGQGTDTAYVDL